LLDRLIGKLDEGYRQVLTARPIDVYDGLYLDLRQGRALHPLRVRESQNHLSPNVFFRRYGLFSACSLDPRTFGEYTFRLEDPIVSVDIDTFEDLYFAREIISAGLFDFRVQ